MNNLYAGLHIDKWGVILVLVTLYIGDATIWNSEGEAEEVEVDTVP